MQFVTQPVLNSFHLIAHSTAVVLLSATLSFAAVTGCPEHFAGGQAPDLINQKLAVKTREICYSGYAAKHSGITRTPLYSAEHLTRDRLLLGKGLKRQSSFFPDPNIPASERAELRHYARSGYDRGHVAPSGDMFDLQSQQESFSLANMVPQVASVNRGIWEGIESAVRKLAKSRGELYVITGPLFKGENLTQIGGAVMVPSQLFKAIYDPRTREAGVYLVDNAEGAQVQKITLSELQQLSGLNLFPGAGDSVKNRMLRLPDPKERKPRGGR